MINELIRDKIKELDADMKSFLKSYNITQFNSEDVYYKYMDVLTEICGKEEAENFRKMFCRFMQYADLWKSFCNSKVGDL